MKTLLKIQTKLYMQKFGVAEQHAVAVDGNESRGVNMAQRSHSNA